MADRKRPFSIKHKVREEKKKEQRIGNVVTIALLIVTLCVSGFIINFVLNQSSTSQTFNHASQPRAALIDQLSLTYANETFVETATNILKQAGYTVDYYMGKEVTVDFYRNLPTHGYSLLILRVHSALMEDGSPPLALFTSESYSQYKYLSDQLAGYVTIVEYGGTKGTQTYFGVPPGFVNSTMRGKFENATIIMMGCNGLSHPDMAKAFIQKGAKAYIGWKGAVSASQTDTATTQLLQHFLIEKLTLGHSVQETDVEIGSGTAYDSLLFYYPREAGEQTIETPKGES
jgi:hypothetical protein